jgi:hypothetical protein
MTATKTCIENEDTVLVVSVYIELFSAQFNALRITVVTVPAHVRYRDLENSWSPVVFAEKARRRHTHVASLDTDKVYKQLRDDAYDVKYTDIAGGGVTWQKDQKTYTRTSAFT